MTKRLELLFVNEGGRNVSIPVENPIEPIDEQAVSMAMDVIIENNVFTSSYGPLVSKRGARLVERSVQTFSFEG